MGWNCEHGQALSDKVRQLRYETLKLLVVLAPALMPIALRTTVPITTFNLHFRRFPTCHQNDLFEFSVDLLGNEWALRVDRCHQRAEGRQKRVQASEFALLPIRLAFRQLERGRPTAEPAPSCFARLRLVPRYQLGP